jgi:release factor glutamine methyltransferase
LHTADTATHTASIEDALRRAAAKIRSRSDSPRLDAEILLAKVLGIARAALIARSAQPLQQREESAFEALVARRLSGTPVAYLTESREFWSMPLHVSPAVLVPRPETEILVEQLLELAPPDPARSLLDLGTGSGAIALAIATERPNWKLTGSDVSPEALGVAQRNSTDLKIANVEWLPGSWFDAVPGKRFDFIVSNPPYVAAGDPLLIDLSAEPMLALSPGATGLEALQQIIAQAPAHLLAGGWLLLEHGHDQATAVQQLLRGHGFDSIRTCLDLSGNTRITLATLYTTLGNL